jgi:tetratricopeptide (TPR) repeat protein
MLAEPIGNPFPGLRPFEREESHLFFGREGQSQQILERLRHSRLLAIVGTSGSGKSSLVRAGILTDLYGGNFARAGSHWRVVLFRPGADPIKSLAGELNKTDVIGKVAENDGDVALDAATLLEVRLRRGGLGLIEVVRLARLRQDQNILIVVDQFEELFRFADTPKRQEDAAAFVKLVLEATRQTELPIYVILAMRSDYIGDCARFRDLPEAVTSGLYLIPRMTRDQRRAAIEGPVRVAGGKISRRLVNRLLNDVGDDPDQLPIMQHALMRTWDEWKKRASSGGAMDIEDYLAIGGTAKALSDHADEAYGDLDEKGQNIARRMFQSLTERDAESREVRHATQIAVIAEIVGEPLFAILPVIEEFRKPGRSFLMPLAGVPLDGNTLVDISHESLIRCWKRLYEWVEEEAEWAKTYRHLADTAALYAGGKASLLRDPDLAVNLAWWEVVKPTKAWSQRYHGGFDAAEAFLDASRAARDAEVAAREAEQREKRRRQLILNLVATSAVVVISLFAFIAWREKNAAQEGQNAAQEALQKAHEAQNAAQEGLQKAREAQADASQVARVARELSEATNDETRHLEDTLSWAPASWQGYLYRQRANRRVEAGDYAGAREDFDAALKQAPDYLPVLVSRSDLSLLTGDAESAVRDAGAYIQVVKTDAAAYGNLAIGEAMRRNYPAAIQAIDDALKNCQPPIAATESLVAPDVQEFTRNFKLSIKDTDFLLALRYLKAVLYAMQGDDRFQAALEKEADGFDPDHPYSIEAYLAALNWTWLIVRGQGLEDAKTSLSEEATQQTRGMPKELADYGVYALEGALWDRIARTRPDYRDWARKSYEKFQHAYTTRPDREPRYRTLASWVETQQARTYTQSPWEISPADQARDLAQEADELKKKGSSLVQLGPAHKKISEAIDLLDKKSRHGRRETDLLVDLLLRRGSWRLEGGGQRRRNRRRKTRGGDQ